MGLRFRPTDALRSSMTVQAQVVGPEDEIRRIRPGFAADAITVEGDPLANIRVMEDVRFVGVGAFRGLWPRCRSGDPHRKNRPALRCRAPSCSRGVRVKKGAIPTVGVSAAAALRAAADQRSAFQAVPALFRNRRYAISRPFAQRCRCEAPTGRTGRRSLLSSAAKAGLATPRGAPTATPNPLPQGHLRPFPGGPYTR